MADSPLDDGAANDTLVDIITGAVAETLVGLPGALASGKPIVNAAVAADTGEVPASLVVMAVHAYVLPAERCDTRIGDDEPLELRVMPPSDDEQLMVVE